MNIKILTTLEFTPPDIQWDEAGMPWFEPCEGVRAELPPHFDARNMSESEWFTFFLGTAVSIPCNLLASYLYDLFKNRKVSKIVVNDISIEGDKETIEKILKDVVEQAES